MPPHPAPPPPTPVCVSVCFPSVLPLQMHDESPCTCVSSMVYCDGCLSVSFIGGHSPQLESQTPEGSLWNKISKWHTQTQPLLHTYCRQTHAQPHRETASVDSVSPAYLLPLEAVKRERALSAVSSIPGHLFVCWCTIFLCLCKCSPLLPLLLPLLTLLLRPSFSHSLPPRSCSSVCLCEVLSCDDENFCLCLILCKEIMTELLQYLVIEIYIYSIL